MSDFFEIRNLTSGYKNDFSISNINLQIKKGSFTGIIGPNGAGKTTLFRSITCELAHTKGNILLNGKAISSMTYKEKARNLAIVSQYVDIAQITVEDYVLMGRYPYHSQYQFFETKADFEIAQKYMQLTDVMHLRHKSLNQLSGGEQQLVSIARALTQEPELLLLDEPTSHLDIAHQVQVLNLIQRLNENLGLSVIMIIHDLNLAAEYCDQLVLLKKGEVYAQGIPEDVVTYSNIEKVYGTVVITKTNPLSGKPVVILVSERTLKNAQ
jgi:iron complex transport system ATP-binding protein